ncbi:hypothetical protein RHG11_01035 [Clostridioides difficile]|nr:hypothetical protein [Clostridioides difficile]
MNNTIKEWEICFVDIDRILNFSSNAGKLCCKAEEKPIELKKR